LNAASAQEFPAIRLVVGLGNPGAEYEKTRHNVGFMVVDRLLGPDRAGSEAGSSSWRKVREWKAEIARSASGLILCKPLSYMNLSGKTVGSVARFYKAAPEETLVIYDDVALPLGKLRLRPGGSAGGHNGIKSIIEHLGTQAFPRLRIGIGAAGEREGMISHVLGKFSPAETPVIEEAIDRAARAVDTMQTRGLPAAMNQFN